MRDGDRPYKPVYAHLEERPLPVVLRTIAQSAGAKVSRNDDGIYVFEPDVPSAAPAPSVQMSAPPQYAAAQADPNDNPESHYAPGELHWQSLELQHAVPIELLRLMHWDRDVVEMEPFKPVQMPVTRPEITSTQGNTILQPSYPGLLSQLYAGGTPRFLWETAMPDLQARTIPSIARRTRPRPIRRTSFPSTPAAARTPSSRAAV